MQDGEYTIYVVQHRRTHESPWLDPDRPLKPVPRKEWAFSSFDAFGFVWEPHIGTGNDWKPKTPKSYEEFRKVRQLTGCNGYFTMKYAIRALKRLAVGSEAGKFDSRDGYKKLCQALRHEFRLVKMTKSQTTEMVDLAEVVEAL